MMSPFRDVVFSCVLVFFGGGGRSKIRASKGKFEKETNLKMKIV